MQWLFNTQAVRDKNDPNLTHVVAGDGSVLWTTDNTTGKETINQENYARVWGLMEKYHAEQRAYYEKRGWWKIWKRVGRKSGQPGNNPLEN